MKVKHEGSRRLGSYLRRWRNAVGLSMQEVEDLTADMNGQSSSTKITASYLSRLETGRADLTLAKAVVLARLYRIPVQELVEVVDLEGCADLAPRFKTYRKAWERGEELRSFGDYRVAFACYEQAEALAKSPEEQVRARNSKAVVLHRIGRLDLAKEELFQCMQINPINTELQTRVLYNLSIVFRRKGNLPYARLNAEGALQMAKTTGDSLQQAVALNELGNISSDMFELRMGGPQLLEESLKLYRQARKLFQASNRELETAIVLMNEGIAHVLKNDTDRGIRDELEALAALKKLDIKVQIAFALKELGKAHCSKKDYAQAESFLREAIGLAERGDYFDTLFAAHFYLLKIMRHRRERLKPLKLKLKALRAKVEGVFPELIEYDQP